MDFFHVPFMILCLFLWACHFDCLSCLWSKLIIWIIGRHSCNFMSHTRNTLCVTFTQYVVLINYPKSDNINREIPKYVSYKNDCNEWLSFCYIYFKLICKCVTYLTKFKKQTNFRTQHFCTIVYGLKIKKNCVNS